MNRCKSEMSSNDFGIDANYALQLMVERDFCKGAIDNVITELHKLGESNKILQYDNIRKK